MMVSLNDVRQDLLGILRAEQTIEDAVARAFQVWLPQAREAVFGSLTAAAIPEGILTTTKLWDQVIASDVLPAVERTILERMLDRMEETGVDTILNPEGDVTQQVREAIHTMTPAEIIDAAPGMREWRGEYLAQVENRLRDTPNTVFDLITDQIDISMGLGEDEATQAARVQKILDWTGENDWPGRAQSIARTEATGAYNQATVWAAEVEQAHTGVEMVMGWMCVADSRTRSTHFQADGQVVPLGSPFIVGGHEAKFPGDPNLPAGERINCRCVAVSMERGDNLPDGPIVHPVYSDDDHPAVKEIDLRKSRGETRAGDRARQGDTLLAATDLEENVMPNLIPFRGVLAPLGKNTGDDRRFAADAVVAYREFPLPLLWQRQTSEGHDQAFTVGAVRSAWVEDGLIFGEGVLFDTPESGEAAAQLREGVTRPSVDLADAVWRLVDEDGNELSEEELWEGDADPGRVLREFTEFTVIAATLVAKPAFAEAKLDIVEDEALVASIGELTPTGAEETLLAAAPTVTAPKRVLFNDPGFTAPTGLRIDENGRISGHLALWRDCHMGVGDACVMAPRSKTGYALFHVAEIGTDDGPLAVGKLTVGGGHADPRFGVQPTIEHYDNAGSAFALVRAGEDEHGIWVSGVAAPWATEGQVQMGLSCPLSGDWRRHGGNLELVAALSVNTPGFPVPRGSRDDRGRDYALVAAGVFSPRRDLATTVRDAVRGALREEREELAAHEGRVAAARVVFDEITERARAVRLARLREVRAGQLARYVKGGE